MSKLIFITFSFFSFFSFSQSKIKKFENIKYLSYSDSLYKQGSYYFKNDSVFFGISDYTTCSGFDTKTRGFHVFSFGYNIATYYISGDYMKIICGTENDYKLIYVYLKGQHYTDFLKENTINGKFLPLNDIRINGKKPKLFCGLKKMKNRAFTYKLVNECQNL